MGLCIRRKQHCKALQHPNASTTSNTAKATSSNGITSGSMCCRVKGQYQAAAKRITQLEALQQVALTAAQDHQLAMHQKQAELVAAKQSVRSAVADHMRSMPASATSHLYSLGLLCLLACMSEEEAHRNSSAMLDVSPRRPSHITKPFVQCQETPPTLSW